MLVLQGIVGSAPWQALALLTVWLQASCRPPPLPLPRGVAPPLPALLPDLLRESRQEGVSRCVLSTTCRPPLHNPCVQVLGFPDFVASLLVGAFGLGCALGGFMGGVIGEGLGLGSCRGLLRQRRLAMKAA